MSSTTLLDAALDYAARGWPVLPLHTAPSGRCSCSRPDCASPGKHPRTKNGVKDASTDAAAIRGWWRRWPDANVGISTTRVLVLDVDGSEGEDSLARLELEHGELPLTLEATTSSGGRHLVFGRVDGAKNKVAIAPGLDVRCDGGYIVAPPSVHATGRTYAWRSDREPADLGEHPLVAMLRQSGRRPRAEAPPAPKPPPPRPSEPRHEPSGSRDVARARGIVRAVCDRISRLRDGRRAALLEGAHHLGGYLHLGLPEAEVRAALMDAAHRSGADEKHDVARVIDYGLQTGRDAPLQLPPDDRAPEAPTHQPAHAQAASQGQPVSQGGNRPDPEPPRLALVPPPARPAILEELERCVLQVQLGDQATRAEVVAGLMQRVDELADVWSRDKAEILGAMVLMRVEGMARPLDQLQALILEAVDRAAEAAPKQVRERTSSLVWARGLDLPVDAIVPEGFDVDERGVWEIRISQEGDEARRLICEPPIVVTASLSEVQTGMQHVEVAWRDARDATWHRRVVGREVVADSRSLVGLSAYGAPVDSGSARGVVTWLSAWIVANARVLPRRRASASTGWVGNAFLLGDKMIGDLGLEEIELLPGSAAADVAKGLRARGTWNGWLEAWQIAGRYPRVALAVYGSIVPAFIDSCPEIPSFFLSWASSTSGGKTTALRLAASVWGSPDDAEDGGLVQSWDTTHVYLERLAAGLRGLPLLLDETQRAKKGRPGESFVATAIYHLIGGRGRGRGAAAGGVQAQATWRTVVLSTGESPLTSYSQDGGTRARVLELWGSPWGGYVPDDVSRFERALRDHHGHLGVRVVHALRSYADIDQQIQAWYREATDRWQSGTHDAVSGRLAKYVAALEVAVRVGELAGLPPVMATLDDAWEAVSDAAAGADRAQVALELVYGHAVAQSSRFFGRHSTTRHGEPIMPIGGWLGRWDPDERHPPAWIPAALHRVLHESGFPAEQITRTWAERGWLRESKERAMVNVRIDGRSAWCIQLEPARWQTVAPAANAED